MKKRNITRLLSGFLSLSLMIPVLSMVASASQTSNDDVKAISLIKDAKIDEAYKNSKDFTQEVSNDLKIFEDKYFNPDNISIESVDHAGNITYLNKLYNGTTSSLKLEEVSADSVTIHISEGQFDDTIQYLSKNKVLLDGNEVVVESNIVKPAAGFVSMFQKDVFSGTRASQYTGAESLYNGNANVSFSYKIVDYGITAISAALAAKYGGAWAAAASIAVSQKLAEDLVSFLRTKDPNATAVSFKDYRQALQPQNSLEPKYKHNVYFYTQTNYNGTKSLSYNYYEERVPT